MGGRMKRTYEGMRKTFFELGSNFLDVQHIKQEQKRKDLRKKRTIKIVVLVAAFVLLAIVLLLAWVVLGGFISEGR